MKKIIVWLTAIMFGLAAFKYVENSKIETFRAAYPKRMDITDVLTVNGTVKENNRKDIYLDEVAAVSQIYVKEGDKVQKGDILAAVSKSDSAGLTIPREYMVNALLRGGTGEAVYCKVSDGYIRSPIGGTVMSVNYSEGDSAGPIVPLFSVSDLDDLGISAQINEDSVHKIKEGMAAMVYTNIKNTEPVHGVVTAIKPYAIKTASLITTKENPARTEVELKITDKTENIMPGYSVTMKLVTDVRNSALTIPYEYIKQNDKNEQYVYILGENGLPEMRVIETGYELETVCEVRSGLVENDLLMMHDDGNIGPVRIKVKNADK